MRGAWGSSATLAIPAIAISQDNGYQVTSCARLDVERESLVDIHPSGAGE